jgi:hypothetical protein
LDARETRRRRVAVMLMSLNRESSFLLRRLTFFFFLQTFIERPCEGMELKLSLLITIDFRASSCMLNSRYNSAIVPPSWTAWIIRKMHFFLPPTKALHINQIKYFHRFCGCFFFRTRSKENEGGKKIVNLSWKLALKLLKK